MSPDGYAIVTISDETAAKLVELVVAHDLESVAEAIDFAADTVRDPETLSEAELACLLHRELAD